MKGPRIPPRPKSSYLYGHGSREWTKSQNNGPTVQQLEDIRNAISKPRERQGVNGRPTDPTWGYTGYFPKYQKDKEHEFDTVPNRDTRFYVPGYTGYVPQVKSENVFGQSYSKVSGMQREGQIQAFENDHT